MTSVAVKITATGGSFYRHRRQKWEIVRTSLDYFLSVLVSTKSVAETHSHSGVSFVVAGSVVMP